MYVCISAYLAPLPLPLLVSTGRCQFLVDDRLVHTRATSSSFSRIVAHLSHVVVVILVIVVNLVNVVNVVNVIVAIA